MWPITIKNQIFFLNDREIKDGDRIILQWPNGQTVTTSIKLINGEFRVAGSVHGVKCWIVLNFPINKGQIMATWPE